MVMLILSSFEKERFLTQLNHFLRKQCIYLCVIYQLPSDYHLICVIRSDVFLFLFGSLLMLLTTVLFVPGSVVERFVCQPLTDPDLKFIDKASKIQKYGGMVDIQIPENHYKFRRNDWSLQVEHMQIKRRAGIAVHMSKHPLTACYNRCKCCL